MKNYSYLFIIICFTFLGCKTTTVENTKNQQDGIEKQENKDVHVVLLAGQSNMQGAGNFDALDPTEIKRIEKIASRVSLSFNGKKVIPLAAYNNKPSEKYNFLKRFGPEIFIGLTLAENNPKQEFLLIKRSQGGTALYGAWNPNWTAEKAKAVEKKKKQNIQLYNMHIADIKANLEALKAQNKTYKIIGLAWMQGENDAAIEVSARTYEANLKVLINSYREAFGVKNMPFVLGQINSRYGKFKKLGPAMVRKAMEDVAISDKYVDVIKTSMDDSWSDYPKHSDNVHYNAEGQRGLGIAFGSKLLALQE